MKSFGDLARIKHLTISTSGLGGEFTRKLRHGRPQLQKVEEVQKIGEEEARCTRRSSETHISEAFQSLFIYHEPQESPQ